MLAIPLSWAMTCWVRKASLYGFFGWQREGLVLAVGMQALRAAEHGSEGLERDTDDVVIGLLGRQGYAAGLGVKPEHHALGLVGPRIDVS